MLIKNETEKEINNICKTCCQKIEHGCRESCPCGYCRIRIIMFENK